VFVCVLGLYQKVCVRDIGIYIRHGVSGGRWEERSFCVGKLGLEFALLTILLCHTLI